jgi:hypothetical protein
MSPKADPYCDERSALSPLADSVSGPAWCRLTSPQTMTSSARPSSTSARSAAAKPRPHAVRTTIIENRIVYAARIASREACETREPGGRTRHRARGRRCCLDGSRYRHSKTSFARDAPASPLMEGRHLVRRAAELRRALLEECGNPLFAVVPRERRSGRPRPQWVPAAASDLGLARRSAGPAGADPAGRLPSSSREPGPVVQAACGNRRTTSPHVTGRGPRPASMMKTSCCGVNACRTTDENAVAPTVSVAAAKTTASCGCQPCPSEGVAPTSVFGQASLCGDVLGQASIEPVRITKPTQPKVACPKWTRGGWGNLLEHRTAGR